MNTDSVITVGTGRGFIIEHRTLFKSRDGKVRYPRRKLIVTASHCLPHPPKTPCYLNEPIYKNLLAPLGEEPSVWSECLFFDPVSDLAVLCQPDDMMWGEKSDDFQCLMYDRKPLEIADPETAEGEGFVLSLDKIWQPIHLRPRVGAWGGVIWTGATVAGQSGSPIVDASGRAVAAVSIKMETIVGDGQPQPREAPQPILKLQLPAWLFVLRQGQDERQASDG